MSLIDWRNYTLWAKEKEESFNRIFDYRPEDIVVSDIETTGIDPVIDEILQIALIDGNGEVLFESMIKPSKKKSWADATKVHGITPDMVKSAPTLVDIKNQIQEILDKAKLLVGFNSTGFDMKFLAVAGLDTKKNTKHFDCMLEYSPTAMEWIAFEDWKHQSLQSATEQIGRAHV